MDYITKMQRKTGLQNEDPDMIIGTGDVVSTLNMLMKKKDWTKCL